MFPNFFHDSGRHHHLYFFVDHTTVYSPITSDNRPDYFVTPLPRLKSKIMVIECLVKIKILTMEKNIKKKTCLQTLLNISEHIQIFHYYNVQVNFKLFVIHLVILFPVLKIFTAKYILLLMKTQKHKQ